MTDQHEFFRGLDANQLKKLCNAYEAIVDTLGGFEPDEAYRCIEIRSLIIEQMASEHIYFKGPIMSEEEIRPFASKLEYDLDLMSIVSAGLAQILELSGGTQPIKTSGNVIDITSARPKTE